MKKTVQIVSMCAAAMTVLTIPAFAGLPCTTQIQRAPEPVTLTLLAVGIGGVALLRKLKKTSVTD